MTLEEYRRADWILAKAQMAEDRLTEWERQFVDDMTERVAARGQGLTLSDKQWDILERISRKAV